MRTNTFVVTIALLTAGGGVAEAQTVTRTESFDVDPGWTSSNLPNASGSDFGFRTSSFAGGTAGEAGGVFRRSNSTSYYADTSIGTMTASDRISASGRFNVTSIASSFNSNNKRSPRRINNYAPAAMGSTRTTKSFKRSTPKRSGRTNCSKSNWPWFKVNYARQSKNWLTSKTNVTNWTNSSASAASVPVPPSKRIAVSTIASKS